ncbi:MAG: hypothetical protein RTU30_12650, partial [Candidatus Thorarchaeota archaeon]
DRLEITEDTRYILNPDTNRVEAFIALHPPGASELALSGVFRATTDGIFFHDLRNARYVSGDAATNAVFNSNPLLNREDYFGAMPLIYPVRINETSTRYAWYCPIYSVVYDWIDDEWWITDIKMYGLGLVDALDVTKLYLQEAGGALAGEDLVQAAREGYVEVMGGTLEEEPLDTVNITATILNKTQYVYEGNTHVVLKTDNSTYEWMDGTISWMNLTDWYNLLSINVGDSFTATINIVGSEYRIIAFVKI